MAWMDGLDWLIWILSLLLAFAFGMVIWALITGRPKPIERPVRLPVPHTPRHSTDSITQRLTPPPPENRPEKMG